MKKLKALFKKHLELIIASGIIALIIAILLGTYTTVGVLHSLREMKRFATDKHEPYYPPYPPLHANAQRLPLAKRGEYLAKLGDCMACHTDTLHRGKSFAGGLEMPTPFGILFTPNISSDKKTGIGSWTYAHFKEAMRHGVNPKGQFYFPGFPYPYFNILKENDLKALYAYLQSIPAVNKPNRKNEMVFPFNFRFFQLGWRLMFFDFKKTGPYQDDPNRSALWNRGAYIVHGLGHCEMCHTPSYYLLSKDLMLGAPINKYALTGAKIQGYLAPNITHHHFADVPVQKIMDVFLTDTMVSGSRVQGPMLEVNRDSLSRVSHEDLRAIATYLKTVKSEIPKMASGGSPGQDLYETYCDACHAMGSGGAPKYGDATSWNPFIKQGMQTLYHNAIHGFKGMPAKGTCTSCSDQQIKDAVNYMVASTKGKKASASTAMPKPLTLMDGKHIYDTHCSVCHASGHKNAPKPGDVAAWRPIIAQGFMTTYMNTVKGYQGHPVRGACKTCTGEELKAAVKYMMQSSTRQKNFKLW